MSDTEHPRLLLVTTVAVTLRSFLVPFADHFRALGWTVDGMAAGAPKDPSCVAAFDRVHDASWTRSPKDVAANLRGMRQLRKVVREGRYDIVHVHTPIASFFGRLGMRRMRRAGRPKVVYTAHGFHFHEHRAAGPNLVFLTAERLAARWTDRLVVINEDDRDAARRLRTAPGGRTAMIHGIGVDLEMYGPARVSATDVASLRTEMGLRTGDRIVLMVAELQPRKGHDVAIDAIARLGRQDVHLVLAGSGPGEESARARARAAGLANRVHFLGYREDVPILLAAADVAFLPSIQEGLPRFVLEAMSMGVPVVATRIRGIRDLIGDDRCGVLCDVGDSEAMAAAIGALLDDPPRAHALGRQGQERAVSFTIDRVLDAYEQIYRSLL